MLYNSKATARIVLLIIVCAHATYAEDKFFKIITCSYQNARYYQAHLDSVFAQNYPHWHLVYIDDCSPDGTGTLVEKYVHTKNFTDKVTVIKNSSRKFAMENFFNSITACKNNEIIVILDGDDLFAHNNVLKRLNDIYQNSKIWMTYGSFAHIGQPTKKTPWLHAYPTKVILSMGFRSFTDFLPSHLRTFYAGLFKKIKETDLQYEGKFVKMSCDIAMMMPMIEMARFHFIFIDEILYIYNDENTLNDMKVDPKQQMMLANYLRALPPYKDLRVPPYTIQS